MTTYGGENGVNYANHFLNLPNPQTLDSSVQNSTPLKCEDANTQEGVQGLDNSNEETPVIDITINNVVCSFNVRCHLNLRQIALTGANVEYRREIGMVTMKIRKPSTTASIWSSGKITCTGATSDSDAKKASRKFARILQQLGFRVRFTNYRVVNVLGTCNFPFGINLNKFTENNRHQASYEPELHPGATYRIKELKATLKIFTTGSITITAPCVENVQRAVEHIFPLVYEFKTAKPPSKAKVEPTNFYRGAKIVKREDIAEDNYDDMSEEEEEEVVSDMLESDDSSIE